MLIDMNNNDDACAKTSKDINGIEDIVQCNSCAFVFA